MNPLVAGILGAVIGSLATAVCFLSVSLLRRRRDRVNSGLVADAWKLDPKYSGMLFQGSNVIRSIVVAITSLFSSRNKMR